MLEDGQTIDAALAEFEGDWRELLRLTLVDADQFAQELPGALASGDTKEVGIVAHSLKSIMKQIGATKVAAVAYDIERAGKAGDLDACTKHAPALLDLYAQTRGYLLSK